MTPYRHLEVNEVGDVTVVRFRDHKIVEDINIQELGQEMFQLVEVDSRTKLLLNFCRRSTSFPVRRWAS